MTPIRHHPRPRPAPHPAMQEVLEGIGKIQFDITGAVKHPYFENHKKRFSGHFDQEISKRSLTGELINPFQSGNLKSRISGGMGHDYLEFIAKAEAGSEPFTSYRFEKVGEIWTVDGHIYIFRGTCSYDGVQGDAACRVWESMKDLSPSRERYKRRHA